MKKIIVGLSVLTTLHAINYDELVELALKNNTQLEIFQTQQEQLLLEGKISTRMANPELEVGIADFSYRRVFEKHDFGRSIGLSQSLLLPSVKRDRNRFSQSQVDRHKASYQVKKQTFVYALAMKYLEYKEAIKLEALQEEALMISENIRLIAQKRYTLGTGLKSEFLQAKIEHKRLQNSKNSLALKVKQILNELQALAKVEALTSLESEHTFRAMRAGDLHPLLSVSKEQEKLAKAKERMVSHNIESVSFFSELEAEPSEDIFRVGVSIALPMFNQKSEEKQLAKIEQANAKLLFKSQEKSLKIEIEQLKNERAMLEGLLVDHEGLRVEQNELLETYKRGYGIAKINLLEVQMTKQSLIDNEESIIKIKMAIERNIVKMNYLKGVRYE